MKPLFLLLMLTLASCRPEALRTAAFDEKVVEPRHAAGFEVLGARGASSVLIRVYDPWQGASGAVSELLILRDSERPPAGYRGAVVEGEARRIVCLSSSYVAMLDALGESGRIVGVSGKRYLSNERVASSPDVAEVGWDNQIDYEALVAARPDLVLLYGITGANGPLTAKLDELRIPYLYIGDYVEQQPLGKAEWVRVAGEVTGCRRRADSLFDAVERRYRAVRERCAGLDSTARPTVMLNTPYRDTWYMPPADSYMVRLVEDAGGRYLYASNRTGRSVPIDLEEAWTLARRADYWLNLGQLRSLAELRTSYPRFADMPAVRLGRVWNNTRRRTPGGGSDFWERGVMEPDRILSDLVAILHPGRGADSLTYYEPLQ